MTLSEEIKWRGFIQNTTLADIGEFDRKENLVLYIGFDATAPSQALGNLVALMAVKLFLRHDCQAIILAGGATSLIGDPGGKDEERSLLPKAAVEYNVGNAIKQFKFIFQDQADQVRYVNNLDWYSDFLLLDFLRDVGKKFSMTPLIQRDYIASRLGEAGISYAEFSYTLLQGYDYLRLYEDYGCNLQLGGSDQWGNCLSGIDLIRRQHGQNVDAMTIPLIINKATGKKFGKSEAQTIFLDAEMTHPSDFYQFWLNTADEDVIDYLKIFTTLSKAEIEKLEQKHLQAPPQRLAQRELAGASCHLVHGEDNLKLCQAFSRIAFSSDEVLRTTPLADIEALCELQSAKQTIIINRAEDPLEDFLNEMTEKLPQLDSRAQIKQLISSAGLKIIIKTTGGLQAQIIGDLAQLKDLLRDPKTSPFLVIAGKNTIRGFALKG